MKKTISVFCLAYGAVVTFTACEKEINNNWVDSEPKLTMFGLITPADTQFYNFPNDSIWAFIPNTYIDISQSTSIFNTQRPPALNNAEVTLFENGLFKEEMQTIGQSGTYETKTDFYLDKSYTVKVSHPGFNNIEATIRLPDTVQIELAILDIATESLTFSFIDPPGINYYSFDLYNTEGFSPILLFQTADPHISTFQAELYDSILLPFSNDFITTGRTGYLSDESFNGSRKTITLQLADNLILSGSEIVIYLHSINYDYYEFQRTFAAYYSNKDNPFAENVQIHSNVKNGLGLIGAKSTTRKIAIKK